MRKQAYLTRAVSCGPFTNADEQVVVVVDLDATDLITQDRQEEIACHIGERLFKTYGHVAVENRMEMVQFRDCEHLCHALRRVTWSIRVEKPDIGVDILALVDRLVNS